MTYLNAKKYIFSLPSDIPCNEKRLSLLIDRAGLQQRLIKYVRLAGSNGKTVCAEMLMSVMKKAGYRVGCLRMPLRDEPRQNICIDSLPQSMETFAANTELIRQIARDLEIEPNRSEVLLCLSLLSFKNADCNFCIIESDHFGDDPSRFLPPPTAAVICGTIPNNDINEISRIRSYIIKGISEIVSAPQDSEAYKIISKTCYAANCRLTLPSKNAISVDKLSFRETRFVYKGKAYSVGLCGRFQVSNAVLLLETVDMLIRRGYKISYDAISEGLSSLKIPAKFEVISVAPLIVIDSTHTPIAIQTVCDSFADFGASTAKRVRLCLPCGDIIPQYVSALTARGYEIESVITKSEDSESAYGEYNVICEKSNKAIAKAAMRELDKSLVLMVSGEHSFVMPIRYEILSILGF